ncbi:unnamed protein product [Taenia asiatica]|uniref:Expressed conserved protein n=1 Tax=Taenia asiatica TaxID=60517 RepID=A0A0R3WEK0_TAEAS|nr:unnamed protein product [Taenia asiatica]
MSVSDSRVLHLSNSRGGTSSAIYELIEGSESSSSSSSEDDYWVALSFIQSGQPKKHKSKKGKKKAHVTDDSKDGEKKNVYFVLERDRSCPVSRHAHQKSHKSHKHLPRKEELSGDSRYSLVAPPPKPVNRTHEHKKYDSEPEAILLPIQQRMRPSHCEGAFEGSRPKRSVSAISLEGKQSHSRKRSSSEFVRVRVLAESILAPAMAKEQLQPL